jgi:hypothetical protein
VTFWKKDLKKVKKHGLQIPEGKLFQEAERGAKVLRQEHTCINSDQYGWKEMIEM